MQREFHFYIIILCLLSTLNINAQNIRLHDNTYLLNEQYFSSDENFHLTVKPFTPHDLLELDTLIKAKVSNKIADYLLNNAQKFEKHYLKDLMDKFMMDY